MPRVSRRNLKGNYFHVMVQGVDKEYIFNNIDYMEKYQNLIFSNSKKYSIELLAYCIMSNHAHMLIYTEEIEELSKFMKNINTSYSMYYNNQKNRVGVVFRNRFESEPIKDRKHLTNCIAYIHNNPVKARIVTYPSQYKYSSYNNYVDGSIGENVINLTFGSIEGYIQVFNFIHKNTQENFIDYVKNIDYNQKIRQLIEIDMNEMKLSEKFPQEFIKKLYFDEKIPISKICKYFNITRYEVYKSIK